MNKTVKVCHTLIIFDSVKTILVNFMLIELGEYIYTIKYIFVY